MDNYEIHKLSGDTTETKYLRFNDQIILVNQSKLLGTTEPFSFRFSNEGLKTQFALYHKAYLQYDLTCTFSEGTKAKVKDWIFKNTANQISRGNVILNNVTLESMETPGLVLGAVTHAECSPSFLAGAQWFGFFNENIPGEGNEVVTADIKPIRDLQNQIYGDPPDNNANHTVTIIIPFNQVFQFHRSVVTPLINLRFDWDLTIDPMNALFFTDAPTFQSYGLTNMKFVVPTVEIPANKIPARELSPLYWSSWQNGQHPIIAANNSIQISVSIKGPKKLLLIFTKKGVNPKRTNGTFRNSGNIRISDLNIIINGHNYFSLNLRNNREFYREFKYNSKYRGDLSCDGPIVDMASYNRLNSIYLFDISRARDVFKSSDANVKVTFDSDTECVCHSFISGHRVSVVDVLGNYIDKS